MADSLQDPSALDQASPGDDLAGNDASRGNKRNRASMAGDDDDDDDEKGGRERRKIEIKFIQVCRGLLCTVCGILIVASRINLADTSLSRSVRLVS